MTASVFSVGTDEYAIIEFPIARNGAGLAEHRVLSPTELSLVSLVVRGLSNAEIANARGTSTNTVANQLAALYKKLGVQSRRELLALHHRMKAGSR
jgi:DNA-binding CsgD family transcriptional regulator